MACDVNLICQREIVKHQLCNKRCRKFHSILKSTELAVTKTQADETIAHDEGKNEVKRKKSVSTAPLNSREKKGELFRTIYSQY